MDVELMKLTALEAAEARARLAAQSRAVPSLMEESSVTSAETKLRRDIDELVIRLDARAREMQHIFEELAQLQKKEASMSSKSLQN